MPVPRRRLIRPALEPPNLQRPRLQKLRERLEHERATLTRWQTKLKRAFNTVEKSQRRVARLERQWAQLED
jgi:hypothetical protein